MWTLCSGVPIGSRSPRKGGPFCMPIHTLSSESDRNRCAIEHAIALARDRGAVRVAEPGCRFQKRLQDGLQIERRATNELEHIGGGGLLLQRLAELVEQAGVLDGDDGLVGGGLRGFKEPNHA